MDIEKMTIVKALAGLKEKKFTAVELVQAYLDKIEEKNKSINAVVFTSTTALDEAKEIDKKIKAGDELGALAGIPILVKDNILVKGWPASAASQALDGHIASYDSTVAARLKAAGAIILGICNMDEFAMGSSNETSHHGPVKNPWDETKVPGGSSGGSAAAVAANFALCALGSDTGGSIRQPASLCGVTGLKPTYGRVSRYGLIALASSLDQIGPITKTVEGAALVTQVIEGIDPKDATSVSLPDTTIPALIEKDIKGMKIGVPKEYFIKGMDEEIQTLVMSAIKEFEDAGAEIKEISMPNAQHALAAYYIIMPSEASSNLGRFDGLRYGFHSEGTSLTDTYERTRGEGFGAEVKRRIMLGSYTLSAGFYDAYYKKALKIRSLIKQDFDEAFKEVDVIISPTSPSVAWNLGEKFGDPLTMYLTDIYTISANLATVPAISVPCGLVNNLPVGLQLTTKPFDEHNLYKAGMFYQSKTDWHTSTP
jgi:aspartyl-tRNA(Asn)/glutamyl-tRNA(Gln) amidotransferase subunit A